MQCKAGGKEVHGTYYRYRALMALIIDFVPSICSESALLARIGTVPYSNILRDSYGELGKYVGSWVRRVLLNKQNYDHT